MKSAEDMGPKGRAARGTGDTGAPAPESYPPVRAPLHRVRRACGLREGGLLAAEAAGVPGRPTARSRVLSHWSGRRR
ncbi:hypothetical protein GCM10027073_17120 [Streptomyces chlorus]